MVFVGPHIRTYFHVLVGDLGQLHGVEDVHQGVTTPPPADKLIGHLQHQRIDDKCTSYSEGLGTDDGFEIKGPLAVFQRES